MSPGKSKRGSPEEKRFDRGVLHVEICEARNIKGDEMFGLGRADPYVILKHGFGTNAATLESSVHKNGGSNPIWNQLFTFPLRNGGSGEHNCLEIEIWNRNRHILFRKDNMLGRLRIDGLAEFLKKHDNITEPMWYPVFSSKGAEDIKLNEEISKGQIMVKFYFQTVEERVFAAGHHTHEGVELIKVASGRGGHMYDAGVPVAQVHLLNTVFAGFSCVFGGLALVV